MSVAPPKYDTRKLASEPLSATDWLVEGMLVRGELAMIAGLPKAGKSLLATAIARAIAKGFEVIGARCPGGGRTLILDAENPRHVIGNRTRSLSSSEHDLIDFRDCHGWTLHGERFDWLETVATEYDLIIVASFRRLFPGVDEKDPVQTTRELGRLCDLAHRTGTAVLVLHHTPKAGDTFAGGTGISAAVDTLYLLRVGDGVRTLGVHDGCMRSVEPPDDRSFRIVSSADALLSLEPVDDGGTLAKLARRPTAADRIAEKLRGAIVAGDIRAGEELSMSAVAKRIGVSKGAAVTQALEGLVEAGTVRRTGNLWSFPALDSALGEMDDWPENQHELADPIPTVEPTRSTPEPSGGTPAATPSDDRGEIPFAKPSGTPAKCWLEGWSKA